MLKIYAAGTEPDLKSKIDNQASNITMTGLKHKTCGGLSKWRSLFRNKQSAKKKLIIKKWV